LNSENVLNLRHSCRVKGKVVPVLSQAPCHEDVWGVVRWVVSFMHRLLNPRGKSPRYPLYRKLVGPQSRSGHDGREIKFLPLPRIEVWSSVGNSATILAELLWLSEN